MRDRIEAALGRWGRFVARRAGWVLLVVAIATGALATQLRHFRIDTSNEGYFHENDPVRLGNDAFTELFGRDSRILVAFRPRAGVFDRAFLETLREIHEAVENEVPLVVEVDSLINARETIGHDEGLDVGELFEDWPETDAELAAIEARARANELYRNFLLSEDGSVTAMAIETEAYSVDEDLDVLAGFDDPGSDSAPDAERVPITGEDDLRISDALEAIAERYRSDDLEIHLAGSPVFSAMISRSMLADMGRATVLSISVIAFFLALLFRRAAGVVLPLVCVVLSVVSTLAVMAATDTPMMPPSQIIPSFLLSVGIGASVHVLAIFYQGHRRGLSKPDAVGHALEHSGLAIVMTSLTTAGGLLSFIPAALRPISHFGSFTPIGVLLSLVFALTVLPAFLALLPLKPLGEPTGPTTSQRWLVRVGDFSARRSVLVLSIWLGVVVVAAIGIRNLRFGHDMLEWFPPEDPTYQAMHFLNDEMGGSVSYEILVRTGETNGVHDPSLLERLDDVHELVAEIEASEIQARKAISIVDVVKETNRALNENRQGAYTIPESRALVAQELLLFENGGSDDVEELVTADFDLARISVFVPFRDGALYQPYLDEAEPRIREALGPDVDIEITGMFRMIGNTIGAALDTMVRSYGTAFVVITALMIALIGNLRIGLLSMIPNLAPVIIGLGIMGWVGIGLDMFTLMVGAIVIGLAVDDTIHFMHNFRRAFDATGDVRHAVRETLEGTGQALLFTSCVLVFGFLVYTQSYLNHLWGLGVMTSSSIAIAFLADLTLAPALVSLAMGRQGREA